MKLYHLIVFITFSTISHSVFAQKTVLLLNAMDTENMTLSASDAREAFVSALGSSLLLMNTGGGAFSYSFQTTRKKLAIPGAWQANKEDYLETFKTKLHDLAPYDQINIVNVKPSLKKEEILAFIQEQSPSKVFVLENPTHHLNQQLTTPLRVGYSIGAFGITIVSSIDFFLYELNLNTAERDIKHLATAKYIYSSGKKCLKSLPVDKEALEKQYKIDLSRDGYTQDQMDEDETLDNSHITSVRDRILFSIVDPERVSDYQQEHFNCINKVIQKSVKKLNIRRLTPYPEEEEDHS